MTNNLTAAVSAGVVATCIVLLGSQAHGEDQGARTLAKRVLDAAPHVSFVSYVKLTTPGGLVREFTMSGKPITDDLDARFLEVRAPFNLRDTRYLFYERTVGQDQQFMYLPFLRRVIQLSEQTRREPFLGSTFYFEDFILPVHDEYTYAFVGQATVNGRHCRLVESVPKVIGNALYGKSVVAIDPEDLLVLASKLYDRSGKLVKVLTVEKIERIEGYWTPRLQRMENAEDHSTSVLETLDIRYNVPLPDGIFELAHLMR